MKEALTSLTRIAPFALGLTCFLAPQAPAQELSSVADSVSVVAGARYAPRGDLHRAVLGSGYRALWTTPFPVPVLNLSKFAGGLTPVSRGGSVQTRALRFAGKDGREYNFRSIDKELTPALPPFARETFADWVRQDMTSASVPTAPVIASALLDSIGILNPGPRVYVLPDDPALGEFREEFAGVLGTLEVHADEGEDDQRLFAGAVRVSDSEQLIEHLLEDLDHRVDSRAFLEARLVDVLLGDFDRHPGQWRWARYDRDDLHWWIPVPEDRDYAFVDHQGVFFSAARAWGLNRLVTFEKSFPPMLSMLDNSLLLTRRLLSEMTWDEWRETLDGLMVELTDARIRAAVATLPAPHFALAGEELIETLLARRDELPRAARELYDILSEVVEVHGTEEDDLVRVTRYTGGEVEVQLFAREEPGTPRFHRVIDPAVTAEIRVYLYEGDDEALVTGEGAEVTVRFIGNEGDDRFFDRSSGPTSFHDFEGENDFVEGASTYIDRRPWTGNGLAEMEAEEDEADPDPEAAEPPAEADPPANPPVPAQAPAEAANGGGASGSAQTDNGQPTTDAPAAAGGVRDGQPTPDATAADDPTAGAPAQQADAAAEEEPTVEELLPGLELDWGESSSWFTPTVDWRSHTQLVVGGGPQVTRYGFRQLNYHSRAWLHALVAPLVGRAGVEAGWDLYRSNSTRHLEVLASVSGLNATVFHGFGNDTPGGPSDDFRVWHRTADIAVLAHLWDREDSGLYFGPRVEFIDPKAEPGARPDIPADDLEATYRAGAQFAAHLDARDDRVFPRSGWRVEAGGFGYPGFAGAGESFARIVSEAAVYAPLPLGVLAVRAGGGAVLGDQPFYDAVFLGGTGTLRGYDHQRLAGDRAAFTGAELRVPLTRANLLVRGTLGVSLFGDLGRVWTEQSSPGGWHSGVGANAWFHVPIGAITAGYARGEKDRFFIRLGMPF